MHKNSHSPPLNTLKAFEVAARHASFALAAQELNITAAAVSHRIKDLEASLGILLFQRKTRGVELTPEGAQYRDSVCSALEIIDRATSRLHSASVDGPLTVSVPESFARFWLVPRLANLIMAVPGLELTLQSESRLVDLRDGDADIGVRFGMGRYPGLSSEFLFADAVSVLAPHSQIATQTDTRAKTILQNSTLLEDYKTAGNEPWMTWQPWLNEAGIGHLSQSAKLRFSDTGMAVQACLESTGVCLGRMSLASELVRERRLSALFPWRSTEFSYYLVTRSGDQENPRVQAFRNWLVQQIREFAAEVSQSLDYELATL